MTESNDRSAARSQRLDEVIAAYLEAVAAGNAPDRQELLRQHPELAEELAAFLAEHDRIRVISAPLAAGKESPLPRPSVSPEDVTLPPQTDATEMPTLPPGGPPIAPSPGTKIRYFGDYELINEIARGGMGVVYKARQSKLNRTVALKMILAGQLAGPDDVRRFYTEAEAAAKLDHPGIVPIFEIGEHEGLHYFSMGYIEGTSLAKRVTDGPLPPQEAAALTEKIAEAIAYAHQRGVIHRDLKPGNVLLDRSGEPKVTDFGLAKKVQDDSGLTASGQILGTPSYMPPEQAAGKVSQTKEPADIYALGAILYALLTGRPPFQSDNPLDTLLQVINREPVSPRQLNPKVPQDLETVCLKCLEKDQHRRYESASALAEELQRFLNGEPVLARPVSAAERLWRWCRRKPALAAAGGLALVSTIAAIIILSVSVVFVSNSRNEEKAARVKVTEEWERAEGEKKRADAALVNETAERQWAQKQLARSEALLYASHTVAALRDWETNDAATAWKHLLACRWDLRGWEHDYLYTLFNKNQTTFQGHLNEVRSAAFSPDGKWIASGGNTVVKLRDAASGQETLTLKGHTNIVYCVAFSPDGQRIASGSDDKMLKVWDAASGRETLTLQGHTGGVSSVAFSPDGKRIASASHDRTLKVWDATSGQETLTLK